MAYTFDPEVEHLLRRAGFGGRPDEIDAYRAESFTAAVTRLVDYERIPDDVDTKIGQPGYAITVPSARARAFAPDANITDARQRWLFRMLHTNRPLQEKMTLFWHNHFATGYSKLAAVLGAEDATRAMAATAEANQGNPGQIEMLRQNALGHFRDILLNVARDTAMLYWLDGFNNTRTRPQENFGREVMELFSMGVEHYTESDVYAAARVFTGWNAVRTPPHRFQYVPGNHDTGEKTFSFPIYPNGSRTIPARPASDGMQDGIDFITALAASPNTARYLATKLYRFFIAETGEVSERWVDDIANVYLRSGGEMKPVMRAVLLSNGFWDRSSYFARFSWPVEFVVRALKDVGWTGYSLADALTPLSNMGQNLFDPPDVAGWDLGARWFSTGSMLARMNFASGLAANQKINLANAAGPFASSPEALRSFVLDSLKTQPLDRDALEALDAYLRSGGTWTGSGTQLQNKVAGLVHLVTGTPEYQFV